MKKFVEGTLVFLSLLLISAHFLRAGILPLSVGYIAVFSLWFFEHPIGKKIIQIALLSGIAVYIYTTYLIIKERINLGLPYTKTALIMTGVIGFITLSLFIFMLNSREEQKRS
ncbi:hypothetical protein [Desulfurobacterium indicum]|uniref:Uncharacterized protein n=1 Tax=Desulfurobacterium indicum TaxID=1914305 RepID=A0A1R1MK23_9BACT|nr:hypothetical protein [Desulfurobacterium indicum]OMH40113.1 hypothetical protein BLW93_06815 [Desulfurobacterium indicum]